VPVDKISASALAQGVHDALAGKAQFNDTDKQNISKLISEAQASAGEANHRAAAKFIPPPVIESSRSPRGKGKGKASFSLVTLGGCDAAVREALAILSEQGVHGDYMRIRGFPFGAEVEAFLNAHDVNYIVEQNRDHQLKSLIALETNVPKEKLKSLLFYGGFPLSAGQVVEGLLSAMGKPEGEAARGLGGMPEALSGAEG